MVKAKSDALFNTKVDSLQLLFLRAFSKKCLLFLRGWGWDKKGKKEVAAKCFFDCTNCYQELLDKTSVFKMGVGIPFGVS